MSDIVINLTMLEKVLTEVVKKSYSQSESTYLVIEELTIQTEEIESTELSKLNFNYYIIGRYGIENKKDVHFNFLASSNWDYNFLAGYFNRIIDENDEHE